MGEEEEIEIRPSYLETPGGRRVATYEFAMSLAKAIKIMYEDDLTKLEERVNRLEEAAKIFQEFESRLSNMEKSLDDLERRLELDLGDISDKLSALIDAFHELAEKVERLEEILARG